MFCYKCGKELPDDSKFCYKCGTKLINMVQPEQAPVPPTDISTQVTPQQQSYSNLSQNQLNQPAYISNPTVKTKSKHKALILIIIGLVVAVIALLIYPLFTNEESNFPSLENPDEPPIGNNLYDKALIGRWRSSNGSTLELNSDGSGYTSLIKAVDSDKILTTGTYSSSHSVGSMTWSLENGKLAFMVQHEESFSVKYYSNQENDKLTCGFDTLYRKENTVSSGNYIGTWCSYNIFGTPIRELTLNDDGTGEVIKKDTKIPIKWDIEEKLRKMYITYNMYHEFDYYKNSSNSLTLYLSDSSMTFTKVSD